MRNLFIFILAAFCCIAANAQDNSLIGLDIRMATCNVRYMLADDGLNGWEFRKERLANCKDASFVKDVFNNNPECQMIQTDCPELLIPKLAAMSKRGEW